VSTNVPYYISALWYGEQDRWNSDQPPGTPVTLEYSFKETAGDSTITGFQPLDSEEQALIREVLSRWSEVANITFVETSSGSGEIQFARRESPGPLYPEFWGGWVEDPPWNGASSDPSNVWFRSNESYVNPEGKTITWSIPNLSSPTYDSPRDLNPQVSGGLDLAMHEIGHALGLDHPAWPLSGAESTKQYTVMGGIHPTMTTYNSKGQAIWTTYAATPQLYDIATIQYFYGANTSTRSGDDIYYWATDADFVETIWDGGGIDTIDTFNQIRGSVIDLREGHFSSIGSYTDDLTPPSPRRDARDNLAIAFGVTIENAVGGLESDKIVGNSVANILSGHDGNDEIDGGPGNDRIDGGRGRDRLHGELGSDEIYGGLGSDEIYGGLGSDELYGEPGNDRIDGGHEDDEIYGGRGRDRLNGGPGNDRIHGGSGHDVLLGDVGQDEGSESGSVLPLSDDIMFGDRGNDVMKGVYGDDLIDGGLGDDRLFGQSGADRFVLRSGNGVDFVADFKGGEDLLLLADGLTFAQLDVNRIGDEGVSKLVRIRATGELLAIVGGEENLTELDFMTVT